MTKTKAQRVLYRLRDELGLDIPQDAKVVRTYVGRWQKGGGAFLWYVFNGKSIIGSQYTMTNLLKYKQWEIDSAMYDDIAIVPLGWKSTYWDRYERTKP